MTGGSPLRPLDVALAYAERGWPVFPTAIINGDKVPVMTEHGLKDASTDPDKITAWWTRRPRALISIVTGPASGIVVLDVDVKYVDANGFDTLAELGFTPLPDTPMAHTPSGGLHLHFAAPKEAFRNTGGHRGCGIGPGLDWRAWGGACAMPTPGSGYWWDPLWGLEVPLAPVPEQLLPKQPVRHEAGDRPIAVEGLSIYGEAAIDAACREIIGAPGGRQELTLNGEAYSIGTLVAAGEAPAKFARDMLLWAAMKMPSYDHRRPWIRADLEKKVDKGLKDGMRRPRRIRRA